MGKVWPAEPLHVSFIIKVVYGWRDQDKKNLRHNWIFTHKHASSSLNQLNFIEFILEFFFHSPNIRILLIFLVHYFSLTHFICFESIIKSSKFCTQTKGRNIECDQQIKKKCYFQTILVCAFNSHRFIDDLFVSNISTRTPVNHTN